MKLERHTVTIGKFTVHYCGWDEECQFATGPLTWTDFEGGTFETNDPPMRRININTPWFYCYVDILHWRDRSFMRKDRREPDNQG